VLVPVVTARLKRPNVAFGALDAPNATLGALDATNATLGRFAPGWTHIPTGPAASPGRRNPAGVSTTAAEAGGRAGPGARRDDLVDPVEGLSRPA